MNSKLNNELDITVYKSTCTLHNASLLAPSAPKHLTECTLCCLETVDFEEAGTIKLSQHKRKQYTKLIKCGLRASWSRDMKSDNPNTLTNTSNDVLAGNGRRHFNLSSSHSISSCSTSGKTIFITIIVITIITSNTNIKSKHKQNTNTTKNGMADCFRHAHITNKEWIHTDRRLLRGSSSHFAVLCASEGCQPNWASTKRLVDRLIVASASAWVANYPETVVIRSCEPF